MCQPGDDCNLCQRCEGGIPMEIKISEFDYQILNRVLESKKSEYFLKLSIDDYKRYCDFVKRIQGSALHYEINATHLTDKEQSFIFSTLMLRMQGITPHNEPGDIEMITNIIKKYKTGW